MLLAAGVLAAGVSGCAFEHRFKETQVSQNELAAGGEPYFWAGPVTYQIQISRQLNPFSTEDVQYLAGVKGAQDIGPQQFWFGVFLWAKNQSGRTVKSAGTFKLLDSNGDVFTPTKLNPSLNPFAWTSQTMTPDATEPADDTVAADGTAGGGLILFKLTQAVYSNRPLTLEVFAPGSSKPSRIALDL